MHLNTLLLAGAMAAASFSAAAQVSVNIQVPGVVMVAPPQPRVEYAPPPRTGHVWVPGHWEWHGGRYDWRGGYWQQARPDYVYAPGRWVRADGGWRWAEPDWKPSRKHKHKHHDHDDDRHDRHHGQNVDHGGSHCPPGQAKKGRC